MPRVMKIEKVFVALTKSKPPKIIVCADGRVSSSGWTNPELSPWYYIAPPEDGILDMDFVADPPSGWAMPYLAPIHTCFTIDRAPENFWGEGKPLVGIRIHGATNEMAESLGGAVTVFGGDDGPWPWSTKLLKSIEGRPIRDLLGRRVRVHRSDEPVPLDYDPNRVNIELDPSSGLIVRVSFG